MPAFRITYEGPAALAVPTATMLAEAEGVELTSSQPPQHRNGEAGTVVLALTAEGSADAVLDAVQDIRGRLAPGASLEIASA